MITNILKLQARLKSLFGLLPEKTTSIKDLSDLQAPPAEPLRDTWRLVVQKTQGSLIMRIGALGQIQYAPLKHDVYAGMHR
ncbi:hypothetical protein ACN4EG_19050, partial [Alkalinema pantanalense CENA528]|uniref:hypothetical protein n=1 Tax=Alkalinema pantanalense TaxID=1620705 RepID=UPI003D6F7AD2